jgi:CBS domain containing-hemolysin-like protein
MTGLALLAIVLLVLVNGFFVASEFALVSSRSERMPRPASRTSRLAERQMDRLDEYLAACQLGITIASLALGALGEPTLANLIEPALGNALAADLVAVIATVAALLAMTALHITIGEQAPKSFAIGSAERVVAFCAPPLEAFHRCLRPLVIALNGASNAIVRAFGGRPATEHGEATLEELRHLISGLQRSGEVDRSDAQMLRGVFTLDERRAADVLTPRPRVTAAVETQTVGEALEVAVESGHSRLPLLTAEHGRVAGAVFARDLAAATLRGERDHPVAGYRKDLLIAPERQPLDRLLDRMRESHATLCAVLDEYGQLAGVVSIEDILEEIVGEIEDESDRPPEMRRLPNGSLICPGDTPLDALREHGVDLTGAETLGGLIQTRLGRLPRRRDTIATETTRLRVMSMDGTRVKRVHLTPLQSA